MKKINFFGSMLCCVTIAGIAITTGCKKTTYELGTKATASFTVSALAGRVNTFVLTSTSQNAFTQQWNRGNGQGFRNGGITDTAYYPFPGTYKVQLYAVGRGGIDTAAQTITVSAIDPAAYYTLLTTGGWKLDNSTGANAVIVGTEANPSAYYSGGALLNCQADDVYKFTPNNKLQYLANGSTQGGSNVGFSCSTDLSFNGQSFTYTLLPAGSAAIATIQMAAQTPYAFIGSIDGIDNNYYRIMSISSSAMVIRGGNPSGVAGNTVFQFKFVPQ
jgi:PKD repeat protein